MICIVKKIFILFTIINIIQFSYSKAQFDKESIDNYINELLQHKSNKFGSSSYTNKAKRYLKKNINNPYCCYLLGTIYLTEKNLKKANKYITKAAEMGSLEAINSIGDGYYSGDIREKNHKEALKCYVEAAKRGNGTAQFNAGAVYYKYSKSINTLNKAIYWFDKASKNDDIKGLREYIIICKKTAEDKLKINLINNKRSQDNKQIATKRKSKNPINQKNNNTLNVSNHHITNK